MKVLELFSGTECLSHAFRKRGHECFTVDFEEKFKPSLVADIEFLDAATILEAFGRPDVIWAAPDCFEAGTPVYTDKGYKNIEDVEVGDMVLTHKGRFRRVTNTICKPADEMTTLKISGVEPFRVTPNHPFYVRRKVFINTHRNGEPYVDSYLDEPEWVEAGNLSGEYRVGIPVNTESRIPEWKGYVKKLNPSGKLTKTVNDYGKLMNNMWFWWLVGLYFADGSITKDQLTICCQKLDDEKDLLTKRFNKLGIKYHFRETRTTYHFEVYSKELCMFLSQFGKGSLGKGITPVILDLPKPLLRSFVDGYLWGDGHKDESTQNPQWKYVSVSRNLVYGMNMCLLKAYGRYSTVMKRKASGLNNVIERRIVNVHDSYACGFYINDSERFKYTIEDGMAWVNVRKVETEKCDPVMTYTLSVEEDESFTAYNAVCHNCRTFSLAAISKHRKKNPETGNLDPVSDYARKCDRTDIHMLGLINELAPKLWFIENPRGGLSSMSWMQPYEKYRHKITYCAYQTELPPEQRRQKPTNLWTNHPDPRFKPPCKSGMGCHAAAPRGSKTGTQGMKGAVERSMYPAGLCEHIVDICEEYIG